MMGVVCWFEWFCLAEFYFTVDLETGVTTYNL